MNKEESSGGSQKVNRESSLNDRVVIQTNKSAQNDDTISENIDSQVLAGTKRLRKDKDSSKDHVNSSDASQKKRRSSGENS